MPCLLLEPDLVLVVVLGDKIIVRPVRKAVGHHQLGVLLLRLDHLPVELVLGRVRLPDLVVRLQESLVQLIRRLDDLDARREQLLTGLRRLRLEPDEVVPVQAWTAVLTISFRSAGSASHFALLMMNSPTVVARASGA